MEDIKQPAIKVSNEIFRVKRTKNTVGKDRIHYPVSGSRCYLLRNYSEAGREVFGEEKHILTDVRSGSRVHNIVMVINIRC